MIIGLDLDDVVFATSEALKGVLDECKDKEILRYKEEIMMGKPTTEKIAKFLRDNGVPTIKKAKPIKGAVETIRKLKEKGHKIIFITARGNDIFPPNAQEVTIEKLKEYEIEYDDIVFSSTNKAKDCEKMGIELFVDDSPKHCVAIKEKLGIHVIGFESDITKKSMKKENIKSVKTWTELLETINQIAI